MWYDVLVDVRVDKAYHVSPCCGIKTQSNKVNHYYVMFHLRNINILDFYSKQIKRETLNFNKINFEIIAEK